MDEATRAFFRKHISEESENQFCIDCGSESPQWASISHGCYISLEASGVHRSLGVHISFVRSVTMDTWKPSQLKLMELGGNKRLKAFFAEHGVPENAPIAEKYNTRAADWYRKNIRALAEGAEPPPPLPEGTGHLPLSETPSTTQVAFARATASGSQSMAGGGAFVADSRHYSGGASATAGSYLSGGGAGGYYSGGGSGYHSGGGGYHSGSAADAGSQPSSYHGFGSDGPTPPRPRDGDDFFSSVLGPEVGGKLSGNIWSALGAAKTIAGKAKDIAADKIHQAKEEGWVDSTVDVVKKTVSTAKGIASDKINQAKEEGWADTAVGALKKTVETSVETTKWAAEKGVEAGKTGYTALNEGGGQSVLGKTGEVLKTVAGKTQEGLGSGADWVSSRFGSSAQGDRVARDLEGRSTGSMQGFGSDCPPPAGGSASSGPYHDGFAPMAPPAPAPKKVSKAELWNDDDWEDM